MLNTALFNCNNTQWTKRRSTKTTSRIGQSTCFFFSAIERSIVCAAWRMFICIKFCPSAPSTYRFFIHAAKRKQLIFVSVARSTSPYCESQSSSAMRSIPFRFMCGWCCCCFSVFPFPFLFSTFSFDCVPCSVPCRAVLCCTMLCISAFNP